MYVSVPKNYSGFAFPKEQEKQQTQSAHNLPPTLPHGKREQTSEREQKNEEPCEGCSLKEKNPLSCMIEALRTRKNGGFDTEDILLIGLIVLLLGKEGNEDIILVLAMLLLV